MNAALLAEFAARLTLHFAESNPPPADRDATAVTQYWSASKCRLDSWRRALRVFSDDNHRPSPGFSSWPAARTVIVEVLVSELPTRVWSALLTIDDRRGNRQELGGLASSVFIAHLEASNLALRVLAGQPPPLELDVAQVNRFRHDLERWTDLLLSRLPDLNAALRFAHDRGRVLAYAEEHRESDPVLRRRSDQLLITSLGIRLRRFAGRLAAHPHLNRKILDGILEYLTPAQFDGTGQLLGPIATRLQRPSIEAMPTAHHAAAAGSRPEAGGPGSAPPPPFAWHLARRVPPGRFPAP